MASSGTSLATAYVQIIPTTKGIKGNLKEELGVEAETSGGEAGEKAGNSFVKKMIKIVAAAKIGQMVVNGIKTSIEAGAELEQSLGGIETLFKSSADTMINYANNAYKTAGVSANSYMEQATSFAASLVSGLGGDTAAAAEYANRAIVDMADNSNKMGTNLTDIQNAYQGFAKQNYTMLDNLRLGYGGTQAEMQRLIADASEMTDVQEKLGVTVDSSSMSFDNIVNAISVMQSSLDITGTTAEEAATTLSGSLNMMKSSWTNFIAELSVGDQENVNRAMKDFAESAATFLFQNLIPAIGNVITQIPKAVATFFQTGLPLLKEQGAKLVEKIKEGWQNRDGHVKEAVVNTLDKMQQWLVESFPKIINKGVEAVKKFASGIGKGDGSVAESAGTIVGKFLKAIGTLAGQLIVAGLKIAGNLALGFIKALPSLTAKLLTFLGSLFSAALGTLAQVIGSLLVKLKDIIVERVSNLSDIITKPFRIAWEKITEVWEKIKSVVQVGIMFIKEILTAAFNLLTLPWRFIWENFGDEITAAWEKIKGAISKALDVIKGVIEKVWNGIKSFLEPILNAIKNVVTTVWNGISTAIKTVLDAIKNVITTIWNGIKAFLEPILNGIKNTITTVWNGIKNTITTILNGIKSVFSTIWNAIVSVVSGPIDKVKGVISSGMDAAKNIISNVLGGIKDKFSDIFGSAKDIVKNAIDKIKGFFNFSWSLPNLKLPHFSMKGSFSLNPPSVPKLSISWYKKAMNGGMILNDATIFGAADGNLLGAGEAGSEVVAGTRSLMGMIGKAVESSSGNDEEILMDLLELLRTYLPSCSNTKLVLDTGTLVGATVESMDNALGKLQAKRGRGR